MIKIEILGESWEFNISFHVIYFSLAFCDFSFVTLFMKDRWNLLSIGILHLYVIMNYLKD